MPMEAGDGEWGACGQVHLCANQERMTGPPIARPLAAAQSTVELATYGVPSMNQLCAMLALLVLNQPNPPSASDSPEGFKLAAVGRWNELATQFSTGRLLIEREFLKSLGGERFQRTRTDKIEQSFSPAGYAFAAEIKEYGTDDAIAEYYCDREIQNTKYKAKLRKLRDKDSWLLSGHEASGYSPGAMDMASTICPWLICGNVALHKWIPEASFIITRIEPGPTNRSDIISVTFVHDRTKKGTYTEQVAGILSGVIVFDRAHDYRVLSYQYSREFSISSSFGEIVERGEFEYETKGDSIPKRLTIERPMVGSKTKKGIAREVSVYHLQRGVRISDDEYRLSHYGLPEPIGVEWKRSTPVYVWLLAGAAGLFAIAVAFRLAVRRRG